MAENHGEDIAALGDRGSFGLAPQQATEALAALNAAYHGPRASDTPHSSAEAQLKLNELAHDKQFADQVMSGNITARETLDRLTEMVASGSPADLALAGVMPENHVNANPGASLQDMIAAIPSMREAGISEDAIRQVLEDRPVTRAEYAMTEQLQRERMNDPEWRNRLLAGDHQAKREFTLMSIVLASQIEE